MLTQWLTLLGARRALIQDGGLSSSNLWAISARLQGQRDVLPAQGLRLSLPGVLASLQWCSCSAASLGGASKGPGGHTKYGPQIDLSHSGGLEDIM